MGAGDLRRPVSPPSAYIHPAEIDWTDHEDSASRSGLSLRTKVILGGAMLISIAVLDGCMSGTQLATRPPGWLLQTMLAIGLILGLGFGAHLTFRTPSPEEELANSVAGMPRWLAIPCSVLIMLACAAIYSGRVWEHWSFMGSDAPWEQKLYPIVMSDEGGDWFEKPHAYIQPLKSGPMISIPMPETQYEEASDSLSQQCVWVTQRRAANGAVQILTDGSVNLSDAAPVRLSPCPAALTPPTENRRFRP